MDVPEVNHENFGDRFVTNMPDTENSAKEKHCAKDSLLAWQKLLLQPMVFSTLSSVLLQLSKEMERESSHQENQGIKLMWQKFTKHYQL